MNPNLIVPNLDTALSLNDAFDLIATIHEPPKKIPNKSNPSQPIKIPITTPIINKSTSNITTITIPVSDDEEENDDIYSDDDLEYIKK